MAISIGCVHAVLQCKNAILAKLGKTPRAVVRRGPAAAARAAGAYLWVLIKGDAELVAIMRATARRRCQQWSRRRRDPLAGGGI
jgi:hypothetical protein